MAKIYKTTDRLKVKIGGLVFTISPLTRLQKADIQSMIIEGKISDAAYTAVKYAVKSVDGLEDSEGKYELTFDETGYMTDECLDDLSNLSNVTELQVVCLAFLNGVPGEFVDPETGKKLKNVEYLKDEGDSEKKPKLAG